jgi:Uma2 family endonuclease
MSSAFKLIPQYTYDDYCLWEGQWELIQGIPFAMSPAPRPEHQKVAGNLHGEFRTALKKAGCGCQVYQPIDYKISEETVFNPDLLVVCKPIEKAFLDFPPELVVEILSKATQFKDRNTKFNFYEAEGIPYYLLIDVDKKVVEIFQLNKDKIYERREVDLAAPFQFSFASCSFAIMLNDIWE